jgi:hypothetical protein
VDRRQQHDRKNVECAGGASTAVAYPGSPYWPGRHSAAGDRRSSMCRQGQQVCTRCIHSSKGRAKRTDVVTHCCTSTGLGR